MKTEKITSGWMSRYFRFVFKLFIIAFFLCYVTIGVGASIMLVRKTAHRNQDITALTTLIEKSVRIDDLHTVTEWVADRPLSETDALIGLITPRSGELEPSLFLEISARELRLNHTEEALFWSQMGSYRLRYDVLRCGSSGSHVLLENMMKSLMSSSIKGLLRKHPELVKKTMRRVMDFDKKYPANNSPTFVCRIIDKTSKDAGAPMAKEHWPATRDFLREETEDFLKSPD